MTREKEETVPKLSVIMPVYNAAGTLPKALDSVLGQSLKDLEIVCVDDGSTDESLEVLREYAGRERCVKVLAQEHRGVGPALDWALEVATGDYVHVLSPADEVLPYAYRVLCDKADKHRLDVLRCAALDWSEQEQSFVANPRAELADLRPGDFNRLLDAGPESPIHAVGTAPWAGLYRRMFLVEKGLGFEALERLDSPAFFYAAVTNADRMMACRDRAVAHAVPDPAVTIGECRRMIDRTLERMTADGVDVRVQERILCREFDRLADCFEHGGDEEEAAEYVRGYRGPYAHVLRHRYSEAHKRRPAEFATSAATQPMQKIVVRHEAHNCPKVSVVVPVHNAEDHLNEALHSLSVQTLEEMEFVCVNDGSTDGSLAILKEYAALDGRFRILDGASVGFGAAVNRGIDAALGEYLSILMPDDIVEPEMFDELYRIARKKRLDLVKAGFCRFALAPDGSMSKRVSRLTTAASFYGRMVRPLDEPKTFHFDMSAWGGICGLEFLRRWRIRFNEAADAFLQDEGFWFRAFSRAERAWFVDKPYYLRRSDAPDAPMIGAEAMYAATEEYRFVGEWINQYPDLQKRIERIYYKKKLDGFYATLARLSPQLQLEFLRHVRDELKDPLEWGMFAGPVMDRYDLLRLREIVADPQAYRDHVRVSVVVPVRNAAPCLRRTLDALLARNDVQFEVVCVDDGSTDDTRAVLRDYEERDPRVRVALQERAGAGAACNVGMDMAHGEYLWFLDVGSVYEPETLGCAFRRAQQTRPDILVMRSDRQLEADGRRVDAPETVRDVLLPRHRPFAGADILLAAFEAFAGWSWDKLYRADFVREAGLRFQEIDDASDLRFVGASIVKAERIDVLDEVLVHRVVNAGPATSADEQDGEGLCEALTALRDQLQAWGLYEEREQDYVNYCLNYALGQLDALTGPAYRRLYDKLKGGWLEEADVLAHDQGFWYNDDEYMQLQRILSCTAEEYLFWRLNRVRAERDDLGRELLRVRADRDAQAAETTRLRSSGAWKAGRVVTWPLRKLEDWARNRFRPARIGY